MRSLGVSAKAFWGFVGLVALALVLFAVGFTSFFARPRSRDREFETISRRLDAHEIQAWSKIILKEHTNAAQLCFYFHGMTPDLKTSVLSNPPAFLKEMAMFGRMGPVGVSVSPAGPSSNRCITLLYVESYGFGGDGHCVKAGDETYRTATNAGCIEWIPGVHYEYVHSP